MVRTHCVEILVLTSSLCRPHPVKPLTSSQSEKKEGRSVLEKLKSTIHPGRGAAAAQQVAAEPEKTQVNNNNNTTLYEPFKTFHLKNINVCSSTGGHLQTHCGFPNLTNVAFLLIRLLLIFWSGSI